MVWERASYFEELKEIKLTGVLRKGWRVAQNEVIMGVWGERCFQTMVKTSGF